MFSVCVLSNVCNFVLWNIILCYDFVISQNSCSQMIKVVLLPQQRVYKKHGLWQPPSESRPGSVWEAGPADFVPCAAKTISVELPCSQWIRVTVTQVMVEAVGLQGAAAPTLQALWLLALAAAAAITRSRGDDLSATPTADSYHNLHQKLQHASSHVFPLRCVFSFSFFYSRWSHSQWATSSCSFSLLFSLNILICLLVWMRWLLSLYVW